MGDLWKEVVIAINLYFILGPSPSTLPLNLQHRIYLSPHVVETEGTEQKRMSEAAEYESQE